MPRHMAPHSNTTEGHDANSNPRAQSSSRTQPGSGREPHLCRRRMWSRWMAWALGPLPFRLESRDSKWSDRLWISGPVVVRMPSRVLARPLGTLPQHAISRPPAKRTMAVATSAVPPRPGRSVIRSHPRRHVRRRVFATGAALSSATGDASLKKPLNHPMPCPDGRRQA